MENIEHLKVLGSQSHFYITLSTLEHKFVNTYTYLSHFYSTFWTLKPEFTQAPVYVCDTHIFFHTTFEPKIEKNLLFIPTHATLNRSISPLEYHFLLDEHSCMCVDTNT